MEETEIWRRMGTSLLPFLLLFLSPSRCSWHSAGALLALNALPTLPPP